MACFALKDFFICIFTCTYIYDQLIAVFFPAVVTLS